MKAIQESIHRLEQRAGGAWAQQHLAAWRAPNGIENGIRVLIVGLADYGYAHSMKHHQVVGVDGFLGLAFKQIAESIITLLNGDLGRFDGGTLDALVRAICAENGVKLDQ